MNRRRSSVALAVCLLTLAAGPALAQNLLPNSGFDSGLAPWTASAIPASWSTEDAAGSPASGSVQLVNDLPGGPVGGPGAYSPCVPVAPGSYQAAIDFLVPQDQGATGEARLGIRWHASPFCGDNLGGLTGPRLASEDSIGTWTRRSETFTVPPEASFLQVSLDLGRQEPDSSFTAYYDNPAVCPAGGPCAGASEGWITDPAYPDFRFRVQITPPGEAPILGARESLCQPEVVCVSGALPGRAEVFLRILGPRPNGFLWPTIVRFTPSRVDVEIEQLSTGLVRVYTLDAVPTGTETDLSGLQDREGFLP